MSDPMTTRDPPQSPPPEGQPKSKPTAWLWILLLIALLVLAWYFLAGRDTSDATTAPATTTQTEVGEAATPETDAPPAKAPVKDNTAAADSDAGDASSAGQNQPATAIARLQPEYPRNAYREGVEGTVLLLAHIDVNGMTTDVEVLKSSDSSDLDRAARAAVGKWRFEPAIENGVPVASTVEVPITFSRE